MIFDKSKTRQDSFLKLSSATHDCKTIFTNHVICYFICTIFRSKIHTQYGNHQTQVKKNPWTIVITKIGLTNNLIPCLVKKWTRSILVMVTSYDCDHFVQWNIYILVSNLRLPHVNQSAYVSFILWNILYINLKSVCILFSLIRLENSSLRWIQCLNSSDKFVLRFNSIYFIHFL